MIEKPKTGGEVLLEKKGKKYFKKLAKDGWKKRRENLAKWKKENATSSK